MVWIRGGGGGGLEVKARIWIICMELTIVNCLEQEAIRL